MNNNVTAYLISDGTRPGSAQLEADLRSVANVLLVAPVYATTGDLEDPLIVNQAAFRARHLRWPTTGEVGCALAHREVHIRLAEASQPWAFVFEDDAVIGDFAQFRSRWEIYDDVLNSDDPVVINLNVNAIPRPLGGSNKKPAPLFRAKTAPYPATAYALNRSAAQAMARRQDPIQHQADWPVSTLEARFFIDLCSSVTEATQLISRIDEVEPREIIPLQRKLAAWSWGWFVANNKYFDSPRDYWNSVPKKRLSYHLFALRQKWKAALAKIGSSKSAVSDVSQ